MKRGTENADVQSLSSTHFGPEKIWLGLTIFPRGIKLQRKCGYKHQISANIRIYNTLRAMSQLIVHATTDFRQNKIKPWISVLPDMACFSAHQETSASQRSVPGGAGMEIPRPMPRKQISTYMNMFIKNCPTTNISLKYLLWLYQHIIPKPDSTRCLPSLFQVS